MAFDDVAGFALLFAMQAVDDERRREHARSVVRVLCLDPRLEPLIPLPTNSRKSRAAYERVIDGIKGISREPEPQRTRDIEQLFALVEQSVLGSKGAAPCGHFEAGTTSWSSGSTGARSV